LNDCCRIGAPEAMSKLEELKIGTRPFFYPMHKQPVFRKMGLFENQSHGNSERLAEKGFYVPAGIGISEEEIHFVADTLRNTVRN
jgi:perosamine synthetase